MADESYCSGSVWYPTIISCFTLRNTFFWFCLASNPVKKRYTTRHAIVLQIRRAREIEREGGWEREREGDAVDGE